VGNKVIVSKALYLGLSVLSISLGTWGVLHPYSAPLEVREIRGSKVNPNSPYRNEQNVLGGGDFATFVPGAFVAIHFARPYSFTAIRHTYPFPEYAFPWLRVTSAEVQWSDDGVAWHVADTQRSFGTTMYFYVGASGAHEWWRFIITGWGGLPDLTLGNFWLDLADRPYTIPYDVAWGLVCAGILGLLFALGALTVPGAFMLITVGAMTFVFSYALLLAPYRIISTADSPGYVQPLLFGTYNSFRTIGYPNFLRLVHLIFGLGKIAIVQLSIQLLSLTVLGLVVWRCYGLFTGLIIIAGGALFFSGWIVFSAPYILTEPLTTSGLLLATAGIIGATRHPNSRMFLLAGCGLLLATLAKSTGLAVTLAAVPIVRFLPRGCRVRGLTLIAGPPIAVCLLMAAHHYSREGVFLAQSEAGIALAGHVGWMLQGELPDHPGLIGILKDAAAPAMAGKNPADMKISALSHLDDYIDYTSGLSDAILMDRILPTLRQNDPNITWTELNTILTRVALSSIEGDPLAYIKHVAAHFYGMWRQVGRAWMDLQSAAIGFRSAYELHFPVVIPPLLGPPFTADEIRVAARTQATVMLAAGEILNYLAPRVRNRLSPSIQLTHDWMKLRTYVSIGLGALSIFLCAGILFPGSLAVAYRTEIILALMLNAYMLSYALVVWSAVNRYLGPVIPLIFALTVCFTHTSLKALRTICGVMTTLMRNGRDRRIGKTR
jgi:hypothetical protein